MSVSDRTPLRQSLLSTAGVSLVALLVAAFTGLAFLPLTPLYPAKAAGAFAGATLIAAIFVDRHHHFTRFGLANQTTMVRAMIVALVAGLIGEPRVPAVASAAAGATLAATALDFVDGWLARRTGMAGGFGARFDLEVDAALVSILSILVWQHGKAGFWVLLSGLVRYVFVAGGWAWPWLRRPLAPARRRQAICVVQIAGLGVAILPGVPPPASGTIAGAALAALMSSFFIDIRSLWRSADPQNTAAHGFWRWASLAIAVIALDVLLTFRNVWPTPMVTWDGSVSVELAVCALLLAFAGIRFGGASRTLPSVLSILGVVLIAGRYAEVTAPALYGRQINLYWDVRHVSAVAAMLARAASWLVVVLTIGAAIVIPVGLYVVVRSALGRVSDAMERIDERRVLVVLSSAVVMLFAAQRLDVHAPTVPRFATPVTWTYAQQARLLAREMTATRDQRLAASPSFDSSLAAVRGADVFVLFLESYGAVSYDRPQFAAALAPPRARFDTAIRETRRRVVSAFVESPTFGGGSWLAHISLLSGIEVRDEDTSAILMAQRRATMVTAFAHRGYRTVAIMPGLQQSWPEGAFYGFDQIVDKGRVDYRGPPFGWWSIPDQFAMAHLDAQELNKAPRAPLFVFFPTTNTHTPFAPTPPYQPDWPRVLTSAPYDPAPLEQAWEEVPDWLNLGPSYVRALSTAYEWLGGYLRLRSDRDFVMVLIGDHQPPAAVSGPGASWEVPVHVIATRHDVLDRLTASGFGPGLTPHHPALARMHALTPILLAAFGG